MKTTITIFMLALIGWSNLATAQAPDWAWAKSAGSMGNELSSNITCDLYGDIYVTGNFSSDSITFGTTTLTNAGFLDFYFVKYDAAGNVLWAKSFGGTSYDYAQSVCVDSSGNVFITGQFISPTITFGATTLINTQIGKSDIYLVKYDANGNVLV